MNQWWGSAIPLSSRRALEPTSSGWTVTHTQGARDYLHHMLRSLRLARTHRPLQRRTLGTVAAAAGGVGRGPGGVGLMPRRHALLLTGCGTGLFAGAGGFWMCALEPGEQRQKAKNAELVAAAISGDAAAITRLIAQGADPNSCDGWYSAALGKAAYHGHRAAVEALLEGGARVDERDVDGWTALMFAATWGKSDCLLPLLLNNASMTAKNRGGLTALDQAKLMSRRGSTTSTRHRKAIECVAVLEAWAAGTRDPVALEAVLAAASCMELSNTKKKNLVLARDLGAGRPP